jgi:hypothetical protein
MIWPPKCRRCGEPLEEPGALAFGPPAEGERVKEAHLCAKKCWPAFLEWLDRWPE